MGIFNHRDAARSPDIAGMRKQAARFRERLSEVKAQIGTSEFAWYPYPTLASFDHLDRLLKGGHRSVLALAEDLPLLDLGCQDGDLSFFLESLGCDVHAVDFPEWNHNHMLGVARLREALGSRIELHEIDLDSQFRLPDHLFGLAFFFGVLYHLKNPFQALEILASRARYCLLSTRIAQYTPGSKTRIKDEPLAYLLNPRETNDDPTNYWIFSEAGLRRLFERSGWQVLEFITVGCTENSDPVSAQADERAFCLLRSRVAGDGRLELRNGWHRLECASYRWTERRFSARLKAPVPGRPARLTLRFHLSAETLAQLGPITLGAQVSGVPLSSQTYAAHGNQLYSCEVPAAALTGARVEVEFALDRAVPPSPQDRRELGVVVPFPAPSGDAVDAEPPLTLE